MFPVTLDELIPADHLCRVIEAFVGRLAMPELGCVRSEPAETGRPGYDPRDLLKLYLYGYMNQLRSSRRLEAECKRNVEVMWLLGRLRPDYNSIAVFRRMHREAVKEAGAGLVRLAREVGLVRGEWVAIDGSKFRAVSSAARVKEREAVQRYLEEMEVADAQEEVVIDPSADLQRFLSRLPSTGREWLELLLSNVPPVANTPRLKVLPTISDSLVERLTLEVTNRCLVWAQASVTSGSGPKQERSRAVPHRERLTGLASISSRSFVHCPVETALWSDEPSRFGGGC